MPDKLTDKEIKKSLEYRLKVNNGTRIDKEALDLINRQEEKIKLLEKYQTEFLKERLKTEELEERLEEVKAENERLSQFGGILLRNGSKLFKEIQTAKAEAYKEFAEELKKRIFFVNIHNCEKAEIKCIDLKPKHIDNLLKELVGDNNGSR